MLHRLFRMLGHGPALFLLLLLGTVGCGDDAGISPDGGSADAGPRADAAGATCDDAPASHFLARGGAVLEPTVRFAASEQHLLVVWEEYQVEGGLLVPGPVLSARLSPGQPPPAPVRIIEPTTDVRGIVEVARMGTGHVAVFDRQVGPGEEDIEVAVLPLDESGAVAGNIGTLAGAPSARLGVALSTEGGGTAWTATWGPPSPPQASFALHPLHAGANAATGTLPLGEDEGVRPGSLRWLPHGDGFAFVYERADRAGAFFEVSGTAPALTGTGVELSADGVGGRLYRVGDRFAIAQEEETNEDFQAGLILFDASGQVLASHRADARPLSGDEGIYLTDLLVEEDQLRLLWTVRIGMPGQDTQARVYEARYDAQDGSVVAGPRELFTLDPHAESYELGYEFPTVTYAARVGDYLAVIYGVNYYESDDGGQSATIAGTDYYVTWSCADAPGGA